MQFVMDASITLSWAFPDEQDPMAQKAAELLEFTPAQALVPMLWWMEVRNILIVNERRKRITPARTASFLNEISELNINIDFGMKSSPLLELSRDFNLSVYDAAYLALAIRENVPIATLDKSLRSAAAGSGIALLA